MAKYVNRITHKGKGLIFLDVAGKTEEQGLEAWAEMKPELMKEEGVCLILVDTRQVTMSPALVNKAKDAGSVVRKDPRNRFAFVGLTGLRSQRPARQRGSALQCSLRQIGRGGQGLAGERA